MLIYVLIFVVCLSSFICVYFPDKENELVESMQIAWRGKAGVWKGERSLWAQALPADSQDMGLCGLLSEEQSAN